MITRRPPAKHQDIFRYINCSFRPGFEPTTSSLPSGRTSNWATGITIMIFSGLSMSVLPPHFLEPISSFENSVAGGRGGGGGGGRNDFKKKPQHDIWHVQLEQTQKPSSRQMPTSSQQLPVRESPSKISQLENSIAFMTKQHNEVLTSLQSEVDALKTKNRGLLYIFFVFPRNEQSWF